VSAGFSVHPAVFAPAEISALATSLESTVLERTRAGARHLMGITTVRRLAEDPRLVAIARNFLGSEACPFRATLLDKSPDANWLVAWHQDTALPIEARVAVAGWGSWSEKQGILYAHAPAFVLERVVALRVHLDDSTASNGPLRVIPGSHLDGVLTDAEVSARAAGATSVTCVVSRGGVVAMRPLIIHASSKAKAPAARRVLHIEYADSLELGAGVRLRAA
jgi:ectoine hydroxylase-related dioxygenase (phytanoyl-CoA dioxygenase family)